MKEKVSQIDTETLEGREARQVLDKVLSKDGFDQLQSFLSSKGLEPQYDGAKVGRVTEANGAERHVAVIPYGRDNPRSHRWVVSDDRNDSASKNVESFILYNGLDEFSKSDLEELEIGSQGAVSAQSVEEHLPSVLSAHFFERTQSSGVSAQAAEEGPIKSVSATVNNGELSTKTNEFDSVNDLLVGGESGGVSAQSTQIPNCDTCYRKHMQCSSWNLKCVGYIISMHLVALGSCYACYQSGGFAEVVKGCTVCVGSVGVIYLSPGKDLGCDIGHNCNYEWGCVPEDSESRLCGCPNIKVTCSEVYRDA